MSDINKKEKKKIKKIEDKIFDIFEESDEDYSIEEMEYIFIKIIKDLKKYQICKEEI